MDFHTDPQDAAAPIRSPTPRVVEGLRPTRNPKPDTRYPAVRTLGLLIAAAWILGGTLFFLIRFSFVFYYANKDSVNAALDRLLH